MDISRNEQRVLHLLAQGGQILVDKDERGHIVNHSRITRDGWFWSGCTLELFRKLKRRRYIASRGGGPYRITPLGLQRVRSQVNNR